MSSCDGTAQGVLCDTSVCNKEEEHNAARPDMAQLVAVDCKLETNAPESVADSVTAAPGLSASALESQLQAVMQQLLTLKAENQRLQGISFRRQAELMQRMAPDVCTLSAVPQVMVLPTRGQDPLTETVGEMANKQQASFMAEKDSRESNSRPFLELISSHSNSDSDVFMLTETASGDMANKQQASPMAESSSRGSNSRPSLELISSHSSSDSDMFMLTETASDDMANKQQASPMAESSSRGSNSRPSLELISSHSNSDSDMFMLTETASDNMANKQQASSMAESSSRGSNSRPSLELISSHSNSDSDGFLLVNNAAADEPALAVLGEPATSLHAADTLVVAGLPAAAAAVQTTSNMQPSTPEAAKDSPFAAYSSQAFPASNSSSRATSDSCLDTANRVVQGTLSLKCSSSKSLLCSLQLPVQHTDCADAAAGGQEKLPADGGGMGACPSTARLSCDHGHDIEARCCRSSSNISIGFSLADGGQDCRSETICVVQHTGQPASDGEVLKTAGSTAKAGGLKQKRRGWLGRIGSVFLTCFTGPES